MCEYDGEPVHLMEAQEHAFVAYNGGLGSKGFLWDIVNGGVVWNELVSRITKTQGSGIMSGAYMRVLTREETLAGTFGCCGLYWNSKDEYEKAIECYDKGIVMNPKSVLLWGNKANALSKMGEHELARQCYLQVVRLEPENPFGWLGLAICYDWLDEDFEAQRAMENVLRIEPGNAKYEKFFDSLSKGQ